MSPHEPEHSPQRKLPKKWVGVIGLVSIILGGKGVCLAENAITDSLLGMEEKDLAKASSLARSARIKAQKTLDLDGKLLSSCHGTRPFWEEDPDVYDRLRKTPDCESEAKRLFKPIEDCKAQLEVCEKEATRKIDEIGLGVSKYRVLVCDKLGGKPESCEESMPSISKELIYFDYKGLKECQIKAEQCYSAIK